MLEINPGFIKKILFSNLWKKFYLEIESFFTEEDLQVFSNVTREQKFIRKVKIISKKLGIFNFLRKIFKFIKLTIRNMRY